MSNRSYDDQELIRAVAAAHSWRGVIRELGLKGRSTATYRSLQRHALRLDLDTSHFTGQRTWQDDDLAVAVAASTSWHEVQKALGLSGGGSVAALKGHALRLGIDSGHLGPQPTPPPSVVTWRPDLTNLPRAGSMLAASWFAMCGYDVSWPLEPCRYDLLVDLDGQRARVQVKTCRRRAGGWQVNLTTSGHPTGGRHARTFYDPDEVDCFFVIDGDLNYYLFPMEAVAGRSAICLSAHQAFRVGRSILELPLEPQPT
jgi:hypothetical protein